MTDVAVIGASMTTFGRREVWIRDLLAEAGAACLEDADVASHELDHLYVANMASGEFEGQTGVPNALVQDLAATPAYTQRVDRLPGGVDAGPARGGGLVNPLGVGRRRREVLD